ncbi:MAG TPA: nuclease-related domain-containing protein [Steroidobacteraceae bacterium]|nr:nuclease-related domain-containing protein [Steroidobacteraceae bacterium]
MEVLQELPPTTWGLVAAAIVLGWALSFVWRWFRVRRAHKALVAAVCSVGSDNLVDVLVPDGMGGNFHVDFLLLTSLGILVIDLRDVHGNIFGGDQMSEWTVMNGATRTTFTNPQSGLYDRIAAVKAVAGEVPVEGRVVFTRNGKFPKGLPKWTLMLDSLRSEFPPVERFSSTVERFEEAWQALKKAVSPSQMNQPRLF